MMIAFPPCTDLAISGARGRQVKVEHVALVVGAGHVGRQQITGDGIVAESKEGVPDGAAVFTGNKNPGH